MPTIPLQTKRIDSPAAAAPYLRAWRRLVGDTPMRSPEWLLSWWEIYAAPDDELYILLIHDQAGALVGLAPLYLQCPGGSKTFRLLGSGDACTNHTTWFSAPGWETDVGIEVARYLLKREAEWKRLVFESVNADATAIHATVNYLAGNGCLRHKRKIDSCWRIPPPRDLGRLPADTFPVAPQEMPETAATVSGLGADSASPGGERGRPPGGV